MCFWWCNNNNDNEYLECVLYYFKNFSFSVSVSLAFLIDPYNNSTRQIYYHSHFTGEGTEVQKG